MANPRVSDFRYGLEDINFKVKSLHYLSIPKMSGLPPQTGDKAHGKESF
jgi:hypothetical protein